ncbi:MAG: MGH1-like glycoside hydrolase domain-containing protein [Pirellulaceae bacterium]
MPKGTQSAGNRRIEGAEQHRLWEARERIANWQRWGPYLSERQWGTVREDYSHFQDAWSFFTHEHARSRAYRWGEDGLMGICDRQCRLCFSFAFWNGRDPILKERLFGLSGPEGNHGEDVKECYFYQDAVPTASYLKGLYLYPLAEYPYAELVAVNRGKSRTEPEWELLDSGSLEREGHVACQIEYAKEGPDDLLMRLTMTHRGTRRAVLTVLPQLWFRNTWSWGCDHEGCSMKPRIDATDPNRVMAQHETLGGYEFRVEPIGTQPIDWLCTDNETNPQLHPAYPSEGKYFKDAFHRRIIDREEAAVDARRIGTKVAAWHQIELEPGESYVVRCRLRSKELPSIDSWFGDSFEQIMEQRRQEADQFYREVIPEHLVGEVRNVSRQAYAGLTWSKQFYHYFVQGWLNGDAGFPALPGSRLQGRNADWQHLFNRDVISMPDKWEYPWYAAWDLAFHMIPMARIDLEFAKEQLILFLREWYMHPNGQIPAYEWAFGDVNPPVHAWACWRVYQMSGPPGQRDREFLARTFQKLLLNFTWWVNRKDVRGKHLFSGGFLGLDNIGVFDRNKPFPGGGHLEQADATGWMAFYCGCMLQMALELAKGDNAYGDMASKFFEHYVNISDAVNSLHGTGLWDSKDGFYYDHLYLDGIPYPMRIRSMVGLIPLCTSVLLHDETIDAIGGFKKRMQWFLNHNKKVTEKMTFLQSRREANDKVLTHRLLALPSEKRFRKMLEYLLDEREFLSPYGIRSLSAVHQKNPFEFNVEGRVEKVAYLPGESDSQMFGGNSNWRGPVWFPVNFLIVESLRDYHAFYGDSFQIECPTGSGRLMNLLEVAQEIERRLISLFLPDDSGSRPCHGPYQRFAKDPQWQDLLLFHEYFHGDTGKGLGASHQTGWTSLVATLLERTGR